MKDWSRRLRALLREETATSATEYAIMLALIVLVAVGAIGGLGQTVDTTFATLDAGLQVF